MAYALGIDLGTTYTAAALWRDGRAATVPLGDRAHSIPSTLFLRDDGVMLVGEAANRRGTTDPNRVAREFKRRLGDEAPLLLGDAQVSAQQLTGYLLRWVVDKVSEREGEHPAHVTLTCPATWGDYRRNLMTEAAATARLTGVGLLPEPIAAAVYYASQERLEPGSLVAVYDLGGGTFDATVVRKTESGFEIHGTAGGDETIGGTDFDQVVMDHVAMTIGATWSTFDIEDPAVLAGLASVRAHAVSAKEALSTDVDATIPVILPDVTRDVRITRAEFEAAIRIPILRTVDTLAQTLSTAGVEPADLHAVLLVGGSSRMPLVSRLIAAELGVPVAVDAHPKYAVCLGAAISAGSRLPALPASTPLASASPASAPTASAANASAPPTTLIEPAAGSAPPQDISVWARPGSPANTAMPTTPVAWAPPPTTPPPAAPPPTTPPPAAPPPTAPPPAMATEPAVDEGAELLAPELHRPAPRVEVDLYRAGLDAPLDELLRPVPDPVRPVPRLTAQDGPLTVAHTGDVRRGSRTVIAVIVGAALVVAAATALGLAARRNRAAPGGTPTPGVVAPIGTGAANEPTGPAVQLRPQRVPGEAGDAMHAITALPEGVLVAVGGSAVEGVPRAWRFADGRWSQVPGPSGRSTLRGEMTGVANGGDAGLIAVGWVAPRGTQEPAASVRRPAVWTSEDGRRWQLRESPVANPGRLGELSDVAAIPGGGFVATGVDWAADRDSGDGAVLTSTDGRRWERRAVQGLDGPGPTQLRRLLPGAGGGLTAVGTRLEGSASRPVLWTSLDATTWTVAADLDSSTAAIAGAWGLTRIPGGALLVTGFSVTSGGSPTPHAWTGRAPAAMRARPVSGASARVFATVVTGGRVVAIGATGAGRDTDPAAWTVQVP